MEIELLDGRVRLIQANSTAIPLPDESVNCCVTSPPYWGLRDYCGAHDQLGLEKTPEQYVAKMVEVFREVKRVLANDGTLWLNLGDSYGGSGKGPEGGINQKYDFRHLDGKTKPFAQGDIKPKDLVGIPWMVAFALRADGWYLRQDIIWAKPNPMPESVKDRCTKSHEYIFVLSKSPKYYYDSNAIKEPAKYWGLSGQAENGYKDAQLYSGKHAKADKQRGHSRRHAGFSERWDHMSKQEQGSGFRNKRDVWTVATKPYAEAHFATFPPKLIEPCILAGCPVNGLVLDPFGGSGTTARVAIDHGRRAVLLDLNYKDEPGSYLEMAKNRILTPTKPAKQKRERIPPQEITTYGTGKSLSINRTVLK